MARVIRATSEDIVIPDIEHWKKSKHTWELSPEHVANYVTVANWIADAKRDDQQVGWYSMVPTRNFFDAIQAATTHKT